jgi:hypothetical protein
MGQVHIAPLCYGFLVVLISVQFPNIGWLLVDVYIEKIAFLGPCVAYIPPKNSKIPLILNPEWFGTYVPKDIY